MGLVGDVAVMMKESEGMEEEEVEVGCVLAPQTAVEESVVKESFEGNVSEHVESLVEEIVLGTIPELPSDSAAMDLTIKLTLTAEDWERIAADENNNETKGLPTVEEEQMKRELKRRRLQKKIKKRKQLIKNTLKRQRSEKRMRSEILREQLIDALEKLRKRDRNKYFHQPVDCSLVPGYRNVITNPMDFATIQFKVDEGFYKSVDQFIEDVQTIFSNCKIFNLPESVYYKEAVAMEAYAEKLLLGVKRLVHPEDIPPLIHPYRELTALEFPVDPEAMKKFISSSKVANCKGMHCHELEDMGPFDVSTGLFQSSCSDRQHLIECGSRCMCDEKLCKNRGIAQGLGKKMGVDITKAMVYGVDNFTFKLILQGLQGVGDADTLCNFIEASILPYLNSHVPDFLEGDARRKGHITHSLRALLRHSRQTGDLTTAKRAQVLLQTVTAGLQIPVYEKGHGIICTAENGFRKNEFIAEYYGEIYPAWRWFEKQGIIQAMQKKHNMPFSFGFYNIMLERHRDDEGGFDVVFVDACRAGNFASRLSHSCSPNCTSVVLSTEGRHAIAVIALRDIAAGEELTFDYHSVTESLEEHQNAVCFCGWRICRGRYVDYAGPDAFQHVMKKHLTLPKRCSMLLRACTMPVTSIDRARLARHHFGSSILESLPDWAIKFASVILDYIEFEREALPKELLEHESAHYNEESAHVAAAGLLNSRLQSLAVTMNKVKYVLRQENQIQQAPIELLSDEQVIERIWNAPESIVRVMVRQALPLLSDDDSASLISCTAENVETREALTLQLLQLRDILRSIPPTSCSYNHCAADIVHLYAHTKTFFVVSTYKSFKSSPFEASELGLNIPQPDPEELQPCSYGQTFLWGALMYWNNESSERPELSAHASKRGLLMLPGLEHCYTSAGNKRHQTESSSLAASASQNASELAASWYTPKSREAVIETLQSAESASSWPRDRMWDTRTSQDIYGSPLFDRVHNESDMGPVVDGLRSWQPACVSDDLFELTDEVARNRRRRR